MSCQQYFTEKKMEAVKESCLVKVIQCVRRVFITGVLTVEQGIQQGKLKALVYLYTRIFA